MKNARKVLINWGSYDVDNFGDLLFPFLIEHYLGNAYTKIIHASPTGMSSRWADSIQTCTIAEAIAIENIAGLVIGGGNLISFTKSASINYFENPELAKIVHPSFFYVPYLLKAKYGIPYAFNYIGVSKPILPENQNIVKKAMESASYISCRDVESASRLNTCGVKSPITVGLDSAIDISKVFSSKYLRKYYITENINEKYGIPTDKEIAVIHVKKRYFKSQFSELSHLISFLLENSIHPVFIPFGMCHEDELIFNESFFLEINATIIRQPKLLLDMLSIISLSNYYIGSSLHGAIASISYNKKIVIIADETESKFSKFSGFLCQINLTDCLFRSWKDAYIGIKKCGLTIFKTISTSKIIELNKRGNSWDAINKSFFEANMEKITIPKDDVIASSILKLFLI